MHKLNCNWFRFRSAIFILKRSFLVLLISILTMSPFSQAEVLSNDFYLILKDFSDFYLKNNIHLLISINEDDSSIAASADFDGHQYKLIVNRALLNSPRLSEDGLRIILCHEVGHLFGGAPRKSAPPEWDGSLAPDGRSWMSAEGQSDYYATAACFRQFVHFEKSRNRGASITNINPEFQYAYNSCFKSWKTVQDSTICARAAVGSINFLKLTWDFNISLMTPSTEKPEKTIIENYPDRQCRLDTLFNGAKCKHEKLLIWDLTDSGKNDCPDEIFSRNRCWYVK